LVDAHELTTSTAVRAAIWSSFTASVAFLFVLIPETGSAQSVDRNNWFVRSGTAFDLILFSSPFPANEHTPGDPIRWERNLTVEIGRQTDGSREWHQLYRLPSYGFGFSLGSLRNHVAHVQPMEAYTFFSWPFMRLNDRASVTTDFGTGLSWHWMEFNDHTESAEMTLGTNLNARINWGFYVRYIATPRITVFTGVDFIHRSNGGVAQPNRGINVIGPKVAVQYGLASMPAKPPAIDRPPFHPAWELVVGGSGATKEIIERADPLTRANFWALSTTAAVQRHFYRFGKVAAGTDVMYDGSMGARSDGANRTWRADAGQRWSLGLYGGYEHVVGRFSVLVQAGEVVARGFAAPEAPRMYQRFAWRYHFSDQFWSSLAVRALNAHTADALEFGAGYRMRLFER
jgi:Lipid A 3-O-deacylase (PagL)